MSDRTFMPWITNHLGAVIGITGGTESDHVAAERAAREQREAEGPPLADEAEICNLLGLAPYDELDPSSPWVAVRALGFPPAGRPRIITEATYDPITGQRRILPSRLGPVMWERVRVRQWLERFDAIAATIQRPEKRHRHFR